MTAQELIRILNRMPKELTITFCDHDNTPDGITNECCNPITTIETVTDMDKGAIIVLHG